VSADGELIEFHPYPWQLDFVEAYQTQRRIIGLCARQAGKSQATTCLVLHHTMFSEYKTCAITANKVTTHPSAAL
jgi:hypothetical protein